MTKEQLAAFSAAIGFGEDFFGSGQLTRFVDEYRAKHGLEPSETAVTVRLRSGGEFSPSNVLAAMEWLRFETEDEEWLFVPRTEVVEVRVSKLRAGRHPVVTGFTSERFVSPPDDSPDDSE
jgi:hypothetical protein